MAKDGKAKSAQAQSMVTIRHGATDDHLWAAPEFSEGYDGPKVTIDVDESYQGDEVLVPEDQQDHVYAIVGNGPAGIAVPLGSGTVGRVNCGDGPG